MATRARILEMLSIAASHKICLSCWSMVLHSYLEELLGSYDLLKWKLVFWERSICLVFLIVWPTEWPIKCLKTPNIYWFSNISKELGVYSFRSSWSPNNVDRFYNTSQPRKDIRQLNVVSHDCSCDDSSVCDLMNHKPDHCSKQGTHPKSIENRRDWSYGLIWWTAIILLWTIINGSNSFELPLN